MDSFLQFVEECIGFVFCFCFGHDLGISEPSGSGLSSWTCKRCHHPGWITLPDIVQKVLDLLF
jgi:hypothetical protein